MKVAVESTGKEHTVRDKKMNDGGNGLMAFYDELKQTFKVRSMLVDCQREACKDKIATTTAHRLNQIIDNLDIAVDVALQEMNDHE